MPLIKRKFGVTLKDGDDIKTYIEFDDYKFTATFAIKKTEDKKKVTFSIESFYDIIVSYIILKAECHGAVQTREDIRDYMEIDLGDHQCKSIVGLVHEFVLCLERMSGYFYTPQPIPNYTSHEHLIIESTDAEYTVNLSIMCAESPVIDAMMKSGCIEAETKRIKITDFPDEVIKQFAEFMNWHRIIENCKVLIELFKLADKYEIKSLMDWTETLLIYRIKFYSFSEVFKLSINHRLQDLQEFCLGYIQRNQYIYLPKIVVK